METPGQVLARVFLERAGRERHAYHVRLDPSKLARNADTVLGCHESLVSPLESFRGAIREALEAVPIE